MGLIPSQASWSCSCGRTTDQKGTWACWTEAHQARPWRCCHAESWASDRSNCGLCFNSRRPRTTRLLRPTRKKSEVNTRQACTNASDPDWRSAVVSSRLKARGSTTRRSRGASDCALCVFCFPSIVERNALWTVSKAQDCGSSIASSDAIRMRKSWNESAPQQHKTTSRLWDLSA